MFIELTEYLRCPEGHGDEYLVLTPDRMDGRAVVSGTVGCPVCKREFRVEDGVAHMGEFSPPSDSTDAEVSAVHALLDLSSPGGYVATVGSAGSLAGGLATALEDVHIAVINGPSGVQPSLDISVIHAAKGDGVPLRSSVVRGVVCGDEVDDALLADAARILLHGRRMVVTGERERLGEAVRVLASGQGMTVGEKR